MKVVVITGSPHKNGVSNTLADQFIRGVEENGHTVFRFDAAFKKVHPCIACEACHTKGNGCIFKDDMEELNPELLSADMVVFASPIYWYTFSAQIKAVFDRFYAHDPGMPTGMKTVLLLSFGDTVSHADEATVSAFRWTMNYLKWEIVGMLTAAKCYTKEDLDKTNYAMRAYMLGKSL